MKLLFSLLIAGALFAQQDRTVEWRASVIDLERRMSALAGATGASAEAWRADAEDLRASLVQFAESRSDLSLHLPPALGDQPSLDNFRQQLNQLKTAVDEVIPNTPDSPFNLGRVEVTVSAKITAPSPVAGDNRSVGHPEPRLDGRGEGVGLPPWRFDPAHRDQPE